jgi:hypothetical protein
VFLFFEILTFAGRSTRPPNFHPHSASSATVPSGKSLSISPIASSWEGSTGFLSALIFGLPVHEALRWAPIESMRVVQSFGAQTGLLTKSKLMAILKKAPKNYQPRLL